MKRILCAVVLAALTGPALAADGGVSVRVDRPGLYGRIDIGSFPRPQLIYAEPVVIQRGPASVVRQPIYLYVPPDHAKNWRKHCGKYNACGQPVYFVQETWYNNVYVPGYHEGQQNQMDDGQQNQKDDGQQNQKDDGQQNQ